jgi:hypothetical protein
MFDTDATFRLPMSALKRRPVVIQPVHAADRRRVPLDDVSVHRRRGRRVRGLRRHGRADVSVRDGRLRLRDGCEGAAKDEHCPDEPTAVDAARERR